MRGRVEFPEPFPSIPKVMIALSRFDILHEYNHRVTVYVDSVDNKGFFYSFFTWAGTDLWAASANWIAVTN